MNTKSVIALVPAVVMLGLLPGYGGAKTTAAEPSATNQADYTLWDGKESVAQYAKRNGIKLVQQSLVLGRRVALKVTLIPAGKFQMGIGAEEAKLARTYMHNGAGDPADEMPLHEVTISKPFYLATTVVTQEQFLQLLGKAAERGAERDKAPRNPETVLNYDAANDFCKTLAQKTGKTVRLPTEAEWEYACRAGTTTAFNTGATISTQQANYEGDMVWGTGIRGAYRKMMLPVASFKPNVWGLFDMHGNAAEWCADWYTADYYAKSPAVDPKGPESGVKRVVRGGTCHTPPRVLRSAARDCVPPGTIGIGMRVLVEVE